MVIIMGTSSPTPHNKGTNTSNNNYCNNNHISTSNNSFHSKFLFLVHISNSRCSNISRGCRFHSNRK